jgi:hypothetical protein
MTSGLPRLADILRVRRQVSNGRLSGLAHGFVLARWFRNAASQASDTSTHFLRGLSRNS